MSSSLPVIGIDLGTTHTVVAQRMMDRKVTDSNFYQVIESLSGERNIPSVVEYRSKNCIVVGSEAKKGLLTNPKNTIYNAKRLIGHRFEEPCVKEAFQNCPFTISEDSDKFTKIHVPNVTSVRPEEVSAEILKHVVKLVENKTKQIIKDVVITVPAYFNCSQRDATKKAAELANLRASIINEPTAAAIAYATLKDIKGGNICVVDFGGGTLDISIVQKSKTTFKVLAVAGNTTLGGEDIDALVLDYVLAKFACCNGYSKEDLYLNANPNQLAILRGKCIEAKHQLSSSDEARIFLMNFYEGKNVDVQLDKEKFEEKCDDIFTKITDLVNEALMQAFPAVGDDELTSKIQYLVLVGGSSKIPFIQQSLEDFFVPDDENAKKVQFLTDIDVFDAVAVGACIYGGLKLNHETLTDDAERTVYHDFSQDYNIVDCQSLAIGIKTTQGFVEFIPANSPLPHRTTKVFPPGRDFAPYLDLVICQKDGENVVILSKLKIGGLPTNLPKDKVRISIGLRVCSDGCLLIGVEINGDQKLAKVSDFRSIYSSV